MRAVGFVLISTLMAGASASATPPTERKQAVVRDIADMLTGDTKTGLERTPRGPLLKAVHCGDAKAGASVLLQGQLDVEGEAELLALFERVLCAKTDEGSVAVAEFGESAADPFASGLSMYSGDLEIGEWELELDTSRPVAEASVSYLGLMLPMPGVSLWEVLGRDSVRVWYAPFRVAPSDAVTFVFERHDGRWVWSGAASAMRL